MVAAQGISLVFAVYLHIRKAEGFFSLMKDVKKFLRIQAVVIIAGNPQLKADLLLISDFPATVDKLLLTEAYFGNMKVRWHRAAIRMVDIQGVERMQMLF